MEDQTPENETPEAISESDGAVGRHTLTLIVDSIGAVGDLIEAIGNTLSEGGINVISIAEAAQVGAEAGAAGGTEG